MREWTLVATGAVCILGFGTAASAVDGVIEINQAKALAGGVTSGDAAGFPVTISTPGSYRLTGNLTLPDPDTTGIHVTADDVHIDLNGFAISESSASLGTGSGITAESDGKDCAQGPFAAERLTVVNGSVLSMGDYGICAGRGSRFERVTAARNGGAGIYLVGGTVERCLTEDNQGSGIEGGVTEGQHAVFVFDSVSLTNGEDGIQLNGSAKGMVRGNVASFNVQVGLDLPAAVGFRENAMNNNNATWFTGGLSLGNNLCNTAAC